MQPTKDEQPGCSYPFQWRMITSLSFHSFKMLFLISNWLVDHMQVMAWGCDGPSLFGCRAFGFYKLILMPIEKIYNCSNIVFPTFKFCQHCSLWIWIYPGCTCFLLLSHRSLDRPGSWRFPIFAGWVGSKWFSQDLPGSVFCRRSWDRRGFCWPNCFWPEFQFQPL